MTTNNPNTVLNASSANGILSNDSKTIFQMPVVVAPRKVIVPVNNLCQTVATNCPPLKRFSNGDCKTSQTYKAINSESNAISMSQQTVLINTNTLSAGKSPSNIPVTFQTACGSSTGSVLSAVSCPNCGHRAKYLNHCENCKKVFAHLGPTVSVIRPVRSLNTVLCSNTNNSVTIMPSKTTTTGGGTTVNTTTSILRTRPTIISGTKSVPVIPMGTFYGDKVNSNSLFKQNSTIEVTVSKSSVTKTVSKISSKSIIPKQIRPRKQPSKKPAEPECLTLSSDEDEASSQSSVATNTSLIENEVSTTTNCNSDTCEMNQSLEVDDNGEKTNLCTPPDCSRSANEPIKNNFHTYCQDPANDGIRLMCRSIRIGSYKIQSPDPPALALDITEDKISFSVPVVPDENEAVNITINRTQLASILACFEKRLFVLFLYTDVACGNAIRDKLKMTKDSVYYDPTSPEETKKRITILPANISDAERNYLRKVFEKPKMVELGQNKANEILVRSTPVGIGGSQHMVRLSVVDNNTVITRSKDAESSESINEIAIVKLVTYPPPPQTGGILVTSEDLLCLNEGEYLNDVIIDFYLKYIYLEKLSKEDQKRTYIFSSFFYNRLSQTPVKSTLKNSAKLSPKELKHSRVKTWTRHVDIFEKDFLIVPVNQQSHWFLVVICFPRKVSADYIPETKEKKSGKSEKAPDNVQESRVSNSDENIESNSSEPTEDPENSTDCPTTVAADQPSVEGSSIVSETPMDIDTTIQNTTSTSEVFHQTSDASSTILNPDTTPVMSNTDGKVQEQETPQDKNVPCIIIFDSLPGASRWRIVSSLREYLEIEHLVKKKVKKYFDRESMKGLNAKVCRQTNFSDCGVFLLQYAESFFEDPLESFTMPLKDLSNWFSMDIINNKREMIKKLILELSNSKSK